MTEHPASAAASHQDLRVCYHSITSAICPGTDEIHDAHCVFPRGAPGCMSGELGARGEVCSVDRCQEPAEGTDELLRL